MERWGHDDGVGGLCRFDSVGVRLRLLSCATVDCMSRRLERAERSASESHAPRHRQTTVIENGNYDRGVPLAAFGSADAGV